MVCRRVLYVKPSFRSWRMNNAYDFIVNGGGSAGAFWRQSTGQLVASQFQTGMSGKECRGMGRLAGHKLITCPMP